ncbi:MAG TPA: sigma-70 family RNA polymerase sigma factor [Gemmataceae bacterium]|jgi:RNA polymerase sigma-70 factor (ECF subfamily)|nr:sigma-70 family RNA polymerase sigma factor [Gemmataceae bacterium]
MSDDLQVIRRVLAGDTESFRLLVEQHEERLFCLIRNLIPDRHEREDIAQEVFLAAYTHLRSYKPGRAAFSTWLLAIARNKCLNALKKRTPRAAAVAPEPEDVRTPDVEAAETEWFRQLDAALDALPFEQRTAFVLAEIQGLSLQEIGTIERVNLGTVKSRISRAREKLRSLLRRTAEQP